MKFLSHLDSMNRIPHISKRPSQEGGGEEEPEAEAEEEERRYLEGEP